MKSYTLTELRAACEKYLSTKPAHSHGFCWWALYAADEYVYAAEDVYDLIIPFFHDYKKLHPEIGDRPYVAADSGCVPERIAFVEWLLEQISQEKMS